MVPGETENNAYAKFWVTNKGHYGMLWYFLEWSITQTHSAFYPHRIKMYGVKFEQKCL